MSQSPNYGYVTPPAAKEQTCDQLHPVPQLYWAISRHVCGTLCAWSRDSLEQKGAFCPRAPMMQLTTDRLLCSRGRSKVADKG